MFAFVILYFIKVAFIALIINQERTIGYLKGKITSLEVELAAAKARQLFGPDGRRV